VLLMFENKEQKSNVFLFPLLLSSSSLFPPPSFPLFCDFHDVVHMVCWCVGNE
jgi:hypothetical protein